jgi:hypothetical protein
MKVRLCALAAVAGLAVAAFPAHAASAPRPQITDPAGDANGINGQSVTNAVPSVSTGPADLASADIRSATFATTFVTKVVKKKKVKVPNGFTLTFVLSAAPTPNIIYRVAGASADCQSLFFEYDTSIGTGGTTIRCAALPPAPNVDYPGTATVKGSTIVWTVPNGAFRNGTVFSGLNAQTRTALVAVTAPQIDFAASSATYTVGK